MNKPFSIHEWQAKQKRLNEERSQESMSNADIRSLQIIVGEYSLNKILNTISFIADRIGKHDEADMIKKLASQIQEGKDYKTVEKIMEKYFSAKKKNEVSTTGTGTSFTAGTGAAYATPKAFGNNKNKKKKGYMGYKEI